MGGSESSPPKDTSIVPAQHALRVLQGDPGRCIGDDFSGACAAHDVESWVQAT